MHNKSTMAGIISWLAGVVTALIVLVMPLGYFLISYQNISGDVESEVELIANIITQEVISHNPELWQFGHTRIEEYLSYRQRHLDAEIRRIKNNNDEIITKRVGRQMRPPFMLRSYPLYDSGIVAGKIEIARSLRPALERTALIALLVLPLGAGTFFTLRILPIRAIRRMENALREANEGLEQKVRERTAALDEANTELQLEITTRKQAEEELRESQRYLSDIIQFYPDATMVIDREGKIVAWNRTMEELSGVRAENMLGRGNYEYSLPFYDNSRPILIDLAMLPEDEVDGKYPRIERRGNTLIAEAYIHNARGEELYFQGTAAALRNSGGEIIGAIESIRDISERKRMEDQLRTLSCGIEQSPASIVITDREGNIEYVNPKFTQLTGYTSAEAIGQNSRILKSGLTPPEVYKHLWDTILAGFDWHAEWCDKKKNGELYWESTSISPITDSEGNITRFIAVKEDITEKKMFESILAENEEKLSTITSTAQDAIVMIDSDGKITFWNPSAEKIFGYSSSEIMGKELHTILAPQRYYNAFRTGMTHFRETGEGAAVGKTLELDAVRKGGDEFTVELSLAAIQVKDKWHAVGIMRNITGRKLAEKTLADSEDRFRSLVESTSDWIWEVNENSIFTYASPQLSVLLGYKPEELRNKTPFELMSREEGERVAMKYNAIAVKGDPLISLESIIPHKDGREVVIECNGTPFFDEAGRVKGYRGIARDITGRKRAEEEIHRLNTELEAKVEERTKQLLDAQEELVRKEKLAILGQLSGSVGHELRNPLGVMSNAVYFLKMVNGDANETVKDYLGIIESEINNSRRIISDLLDFARTKTPQITAVTAGNLTAESIARCAIPENIKLQIEIPDNLPLLNVDPLQMGQVLQNLVTNAVQSMPNGGALRLAARQILNSELGIMNSKSKIHNSKFDGDFIEISVTDSGEGISPANMKKLFQPLFTTKAKGIGLGLVVCRNLTEANGGRIEVASEFGKGTTFSMLLPTNVMRNGDLQDREERAGMI